MLADVLVATLLATAGQVTAHAGHAPDSCAPTPAALPAGLEGWARKAQARASASASGATILPVGRAVTATLLPTPRVTYALRPEKPAGPVSSGGMFAFVVRDAGHYRVALGSGAWIDVVSGTTMATSVAHGHGPACTGVRKIVDFGLEPGRHLLQVAGSATPTLKLMVARVP